MKLRTSYVLASIHAAVRAAKGRKFKPNDLFDFDHAAAALGYCNAFFTDDKLAKLLTRAPLEFDQRFDCPVVADSASAVEMLARVVAS